MNPTKKSISLVCSAFTLLAMQSCKKPITDDPISALNGLVGEYGFIGYENPLESSGTGTMLAGRPNALAYIAPSESCFSQDDIQRNFDRQHFNRTYNYSFQGNLGFTVFGTSLFSAGLGLNDAHTVNIELNGITIEYLSSIDVTDWYQEGMRQTCKDYLDDVGFVIQALITDSMKINIQQIGGTNIGLNSDNIANFIEFEAGVDWRIVDEYTVEISTPKYIGYQLGRLKLEDEGRVLYRAMTADEDRFVFEPISLFPDTPTDSDQQSEKTVSELDDNAIFL
ncbi:MAG: hypothetical protein CMJ16_04235 [Peredibacter sp.]|nr:hypothetical protein [Peredibacter sp.]|tara:strand:+ start:160 stop:1002 length:843 start_codon:yes stop_codon:yes gene_type:complete